MYFSIMTSSAQQNQTRHLDVTAPEHWGAVVSCADDPTNMTPVLDAVIEQIDKVSANLRSGQKIVVLVGEEHQTPFPVVFPSILAERLKCRNTKNSSLRDDTQTVALALEHGHNSLECVIKECFNVPVAAPLRGKIAAADKDGRRTVQSCIANVYQVYAPVTRLSVLYHALTQKIPVRFTDAATKMESPDMFVLDQDDPFTAQLIADHSKNLVGREINVISADSTRLRNLAMAHHALALARDSKSHIVIQSTGWAHVFGYKKGEEEYSHSLSMAFKNADATVIPVFFDTEDPFGKPSNNIPVKAIKDSLMRNGVLAKDVPYTPHQTAFTSRSPEGVEIKHLKALIERTGLKEFRIFNPRDEDSKREREILKQQIAAAIPQWIAEAAAVP
jgi:hypothetical protein